jgi:phenylalanyl-tRNA synthetase alpha chain
LNIVRNRIVFIFQRLGFAVAEGPEIEDDWHNFGAMNLPEDHPARDMQMLLYQPRSGIVLKNAYQ